MHKKLFANLVESLQQHNEIIASTRKPARLTKVDAQSIEVLRAKAGLTQDKFVALIQVDLSTLQNWEQGGVTTTLTQEAGINRYRCDRNTQCPFRQSICYASLDS
jgi:DNA-binding transcriptional regulator YiaG